MRLSALLSMGAIAILAGMASAQAADEFGARFTGETPAAFGDPQDDIAEQLQNIFPAAGEETAPAEAVPEAQAEPAAGEETPVTVETPAVE
ncbi:MAG: hypothetical protein H7831_13420 [Magnetococcus sp. WYHC-3]